MKIFLTILLTSIVVILLMIWLNSASYEDKKLENKEVKKTKL